MSHHTTHRRNLASLHHPKPSMDPTTQKHPSTTTAKPHHHHQHPDPTSPPSTIQHISNHFSKLYTNHKILTTLKASSTHHHSHHPSIDTHMNTSCTTLTKSKSQHTRRLPDVEKESTKTMVKDKLVKVKTPFEMHDFDKAFVKQKIMKKPSKVELFHEDEQDLKKKKASFEAEGGGGDTKRPSFSLAAVNGGGGGGRRRSFCSSQTELADFLSCNGVKVVSVDMPPFMQIHAVDCARKAYDSLEKFTARTLACALKKEFDGVYGPAWHCIVGTSFGSFVTHSVGGFMYFSMDHKLYVLLFKTTVQKAD